MNNRKLVIAIDFNNVLFGSYYGEKLINSKGINVNAIKGFFFRIKSLKDMFDPDYIVIANDISREKTFRRKLYKQYKAQRKPHDEDMIMQMRYAAQIASLLGYPFINDELYEADDILGMLSKFTSENDMDIIISSSDRDLYQLVNDNSFVLSPRNNDLIDKTWLLDHYKLTPEQWIELKMLQGDRSDNIPGIPGIGEVTALKLMHQFGSIDNIYANVDKLNPKIKDLLINNKDVLPLTRELVTIVTDHTKIGLTMDMFKRQEIYTHELFSLIAELELNSLFNVMSYSLIPEKEVSPELS